MPRNVVPKPPRTSRTSITAFQNLLPSDDDFFRIIVPAAIDAEEEEAWQQEEDQDMEDAEEDDADADEQDDGEDDYSDGDCREE